MSWAPPDFLIEAASKALETDISASHYRSVPLARLRTAFPALIPGPCLPPCASPPPATPVDVPA